jgi:hypothetical protein
MNLYFDDTELKLADNYDQHDYCKSKSSEKISSILVVFAGLTATLIFFAVLATIYDFKTKNGKNRQEIFLTFSLIENISKLFITNQDQKIKYLDGCRSLAILSIIGFHTLWTRLIFPLKNPEDAKYFVESVFGHMIGYLSFAVDVFFLLSGLLAAKNFFGDLDK